MLWFFGLQTCCFSVHGLPLYLHIFTSKVLRRDQLRLKNQDTEEDGEPTKKKRGKGKGKGRGKGKGAKGSKGKGKGKKAQSKDSNGQGRPKAAKAKASKEEDEAPGQSAASAKPSRSRKTPATKAPAMPEIEPPQSLPEDIPSAEPAAAKAKARARVQKKSSEQPCKKAKTEKGAAGPSMSEKDSEGLPKTWARRRRPKTEAGALKWDTLRAVFISDVQRALSSKVSSHEDKCSLAVALLHNLYRSIFQVLNQRCSKC